MTNTTVIASSIAVVVVAIATVVYWKRHTKLNGGKVAKPASLLRLAIMNDDSKAFRRLLSFSTVNETHEIGAGDAALHPAAKWNRAVMATQLLAAGANVYAVNKHGATPLHAAATAGA